MNEITYNTINRLSLHADSKLLEQINKQLESSKCIVSFWGSRRILIKGIEETVPLHLLASKVLDISIECRDKGSLEMIKRHNWRLIALHISRLYKESDAVECSFVARCFVNLWEGKLFPNIIQFIFFSYSIASNYEEEDDAEQNIVEQNFRAYSQNALVQANLVKRTRGSGSSVNGARKFLIPEILTKLASLGLEKFPPQPH